MKDTEKSQFCTLVGTVAEVFGHRLSPGALEIWWQTCRDVGAADFRAALSAWLRESARFPRPADVLARLGANRVTVQQAAESDYRIRKHLQRQREEP